MFRAFAHNHIFYTRLGGLVILDKGQDEVLVLLVVDKMIKCLVVPGYWSQVVDKKIH
jgi:hypothetical protein